LCKADLNKLICFINEHLNESKYLSQWYEEVNNNRPVNSSKRLTSRELAVAFNILRRKKEFTVEKDSSIYCFSK